ncbi:alpha/beta hydrolase [Nitrosomonas sp.]|uniref:alpha/beta hydrolase n=1 Tax=Nitrosomonas sp. TaxID=42353 RepID=UPI00374DE2EC
MSAVTQKFFIDGPAGKLEVILGEPESFPKGIAIIAHPHPLHGGTMDNKVIHTLFTTLLALGFIAAKFNFRGVGKSEGTFDHGIGEIEDVMAVTQTIRDQFNAHSADLPLLLAGFSFGGAIQLHAAEQLVPEFLILVAPSVVNLNAPAVPEATKLALIIQGDQDDIVIPDDLLAWATPKSQPIVFIPGAEHFFHGKLALLKQVILQSFSPQI